MEEEVDVEGEVLRDVVEPVFLLPLQQVGQLELHVRDLDGANLDHDLVHARHRRRKIESDVAPAQRSAGEREKGG